jgi:hypothetical protein
MEGEVIVKDNQLDLETLFIRQVSALVSTTAEELDGIEEMSALGWEVHLYRTLEVNAKGKAKMIVDFARLQKERMTSCKQ